MKNLLVISNHDPAGWSEEQKAGWNVIDYIPFPDVPPKWDWAGVEELATSLCDKIGKWLRNNPGGKVSIQGEFSLTAIVVKTVAEEGDFDRLVFPTTERVVEEDVQTGEKKSVFRFVRWR